MLRLRRKVLGVGVAIAAMVIAVPVGVAASAPGVPTAVEQAFPNGLPAGATVVDGNTLSFDGGSVVLHVNPMAFSDCPAGWLCLWQDSGYSGRMLQFHDVTSYWQNLTDYGFNDAMSSWRNRASTDAKWSYDINGGGTQRCMASGASASSLGGDNDQASAIRIFGSNNLC